MFSIKNDALPKRNSILICLNSKMLFLTEIITLTWFITLRIVAAAHLITSNLKNTLICKQEKNFDWYRWEKYYNLVVLDHKPLEGHFTIFDNSSILVKGSIWFKKNNLLLILCKKLVLNMFNYSISSILRS